MKKSYRLEGLDCANCAAKLEKKLAGIEGMKSATVNFMTLKCTLEADDAAAAGVFERAMKVIAREEPDVEVEKL